MATAQWPLTYRGLALDCTRTIRLRIGGITLDKPSTAVACNSEREVKDRLVGGDRHRAQTIRIDGVDRASSHHLWSWVIVRLLAAAVVVIKHAARDLPLPIGDETSGHQHWRPVAVSIKREGIIALQSCVGESLIYRNAQVARR